MDIEKSLTVQTGGQQVEEWLELANGCESMPLMVLSDFRFRGNGINTSGT